MGIRNLLNKLAIVIMTIGYAASMFFVSVHPYGKTTQAVRTANNLSHIPAHAVLVILTYLLFKVILKAHRNFIIVFAALMAFGFGVVIEICQAGIPGRQASMSDIFLNLVGIVIGLYVATKTLKIYYPGEI